MGFIHDKLDIKFLILYLMARVVGPVDFTTLADLTFCDDGVEYFDFAESVAELVSTGHLAVEGTSTPSPTRAAATGDLRAAWPFPCGKSATATWPRSTRCSAATPKSGRNSFPGRMGGSPSA